MISMDAVNQLRGCLMVKVVRDPQSVFIHTNKKLSFPEHPAVTIVRDVLPRVSELGSYSCPNDWPVNYVIHQPTTTRGPL